MYALPIIILVLLLVFRSVVSSLTPLLVSGSGKSSLIFDVVGEQMDHVTGLEQFEEVIIINQTSITKMKRSNIATYTNVFTDIRNGRGESHPTDWLV